ncbi:MAG: hypothetical protein SPJ90_05360 [Prevotella sp.]|nr:hypothetical protein [Prevotellaceae bacterium]MDY5843840.1 hypothetical protein [Prevotella sp.]
MHHLIEKLAEIGTDRLLHFNACLCVAYLTARLLPCCTVERMLAGFAFAVLIGFGKELYDEGQDGNTFDWHDLLADVAGAAVGAMMIL